MADTVKRLPPEKILEVWHKEKGVGKYDRMWTALGGKTIQNIAAGSHTMAVLWQSAWKHGGGDSLPATKLKKVPPAKLQTLYSNKNFVKSFRLSNIAGYKSVL